MALGGHLEDKMDTLPVWVADIVEQDGQTKSLFEVDADVVLKHLDVNRLRDRMKTVCGSVSQLFADIQKVGQFRLQEVTIQVEITAEGGVELIGTAKVGGKGAITLKFIE
jgi:hypothetical protein